MYMHVCVCVCKLIWYIQCVWPGVSILSGDICHMCSPPLSHSCLQFGTSLNKLYSLTPCTVHAMKEQFRYEGAQVLCTGKSVGTFSLGVFSVCAACADGSNSYTDFMCLLFCIWWFIVIHSPFLQERVLSLWLVLPSGVACHCWQHLQVSCSVMWDMCPMSCHVSQLPWPPTCAYTGIRQLHEYLSSLPRKGMVRKTVWKHVGDVRPANGCYSSMLGSWDTTQKGKARCARHTPLDNMWVCWKNTHILTPHWTMCVRGK